MSDNGKLLASCLDDLFEIQKSLTILSVQEPGSRENKNFRTARKSVDSLIEDLLRVLNPKSKSGSAVSGMGSKARGGSDEVSDTSPNGEEPDSADILA